MSRDTNGILNILRLGRDVCIPPVGDIGAVMSCSRPKTQTSLSLLYDILLRNARAVCQEYQVTLA